MVTAPDDYSFQRYLDAKRPVDERARDRRVAAAFREALGARDDPLAVCDLGAGTGPMIERLLAWTDDRAVRYTAVDADGSLLDAAAENVAARARARGHAVERTDDGLVVDRGGTPFAVTLRTGDALAHLDDRAGAYDAVVAQAFLDLTPVESTVERIATALGEGGLGYFPITFDGVTGLVPAVDPDLDEQIERRYHHHMDTTEKVGGTGDSRAGRHLLTAVPATGGEVVAAGGSDWVVTPSGDGYPGDEAYLLSHLVETIRGALADDESIADDRLAAWVRRRHDQIDRAELSYLTHQLDVLARW